MPRLTARLRTADDDWEVFIDRNASEAEVTLLLTSPSIPTENPSIASLSSLPLSVSGTNEGSVYSSTSYGNNRAPSHTSRKGPTSMHLLSSSGDSQRGGSSVGGRSARSASTAGKSAKGTIGGKSITPSIPQHKIEFEQFHNQVREGARGGACERMSRGAGARGHRRKGPALT